MKLLKKLATDSMLVEMFPHLSDLAKVCLLIPLGTAPMEQSFSQMKMVKLSWKAKPSSENGPYCILIRAPLAGRHRYIGSSIDVSGLNYKVSSKLASSISHYNLVLS